MTREKNIFKKGDIVILKDQTEWNCNWTGEMEVVESSGLYVECQRYVNGVRGTFQYTKLQLKLDDKYGIVARTLKLFDSEEEALAHINERPNAFTDNSYDIVKIARTVNRKTAFE